VNDDGADGDFLDIESATSLFERELHPALVGEKRVVDGLDQFDVPGLDAVETAS
jgi:hypothetical protein